MTIFPTDEDGDLVSFSTKADMTTGSEAIASLVYQRLRMISGEWWEDEDLGFELPKFLIARLRSGARGTGAQDEIANYVTAYVQDTPGVENVDASVEYKNRKMVIKLRIETEYGEITEEVEDYELLRALS